MNVVILITCKDKKEAVKISARLVKDKLAACVNIIEGVQSLFWWEKKVESACEVLLVAKSKRSLITRVVRTVKSLHSYQVPEVIALPIIAGNRDYLNWIDESVR